MSRLVGGRYEIGEEIGRGGMATVHAAHDTRLGRPVAVKMLHAGRLGDRTFQGRFRREAQAAASLSHPNIVAVFDSGEDVVTNAVGVQEVIPYIVMELVEGHTLSQLMHDNGPFSPDEAMRIVEKVLAALGYSHERGLVHRDVKPGNVMLTADGDVKVMDFGIARGGGMDSTATMTQTQAVIGTAQYLSPEQARGQDVDGRSDLYSAGCLLFELVTGRPPFVGDSPLAIAYQHVGEDPSLPSSHDHEVPRVLDTIIMHALIKDRDRRYQTADEFRRDLVAARAGRPISAAALATGDAIFAPTESIQRADIPGEEGARPGRSAVGAAAAGVVGGAAAGAALAGGDAADAAPVEGTGATLAPVAAGSHLATPGPEGPHTTAQPPVAEENNTKYVVWIVALVALIALAMFGIWRMTRPAPIAYKAVPALIGSTRTDAETALKAAGLTGTFYDKTSAKPKGTVVDQNPQAGAQQDPKNPVSVGLSSGPSTTSVPDVSKYSVASARQRLLNSYLTGGDVVQIDDKTIPEGLVVKTEPAAGQTVKVNSKVTLYVSSGKVPVPNVIGQDWQAAAKVLTDAGFRVARQDEPSTQTQGTVLDQDVKDGKQPPGTKITLKVAVVMPTTTVTVTTTASPAPVPVPTSQATSHSPRPPATPTTPPSSTSTIVPPPVPAPTTTPTTTPSP